ncbi:BREX-1 system adenine-specific DNA-methyltransferase PglX [Bacillus sp. MRMR6]|uniref:BREX-1 system adenine-specific DNA-methyltransferase PglX n=1 Tax=Bacillus sp. MRMR6 TaxID=1928617 RepID=UPI0009533E51|nr:BREX-1 system adenine-specific DNA-methyltransferase PglX [Bacillus sp. MRMR6]OLS37725.1 SAM-dependent methyltransferase [Bacillus sp. MRMR6]
MNKSAIKNFAVTARVKLLEAIEQKAYELGITKKRIKEPEVYKDGFRVNDKFFKKYQMKQRDKLTEKIKDQGFDQIIEEVAYTWFNRLIAIRFMEVNEYLPSGVRVLSSIDSGKIEPDAVSNVLTIADDLELDLDVVYRLQDENNTEELFKYILVKQCNKLGEIMPMMFEQIEDFTELLLPDKLLSEGSVVRDLVIMIDEEDWKEQVEIIGWLYQYYISEKKDKVFADLKKNMKILKENIPAATQLFTPDWIVKYMVENSLGRLWLESNPNEDLKQKWRFFQSSVKQESNVEERLKSLINNELNPEVIKVLDPCVGSGHILVYAFDVLFNIYLSSGYSERKIPQLILEKNLYGLDIDDRAAQLAYFALMMKGRSVNKRLFNKKINLNIFPIKESNEIPQEAIEYLKTHILDKEKVLLKEEIEYIVNLFRDAKEYGSILNVKEVNYQAIEELLEVLKYEDADDLFTEHFKEILLSKLPELLNQAKVLYKKYNIVVTNPPYMSRRGMNANLNRYLEKNYPSSKNDLFAVFIEKAINLTRKDNYTAIITQHAWMFLDSFSLLREKLITESTIVSMAHLGTKAFEEISGEVVQTTAAILKNSSIKEYKGTFSRLVNYSNSREKEKAFLKKSAVYTGLKQEEFLKVPNKIIAYWLENVDIFSGDSIGNFFESAGRVKSHNNEKYVRFFWEVDNTDNKWVPFANGGGYRKYYGNEYFVVNWSDEAKLFYQQHGGLNNPKYWNREGITWNLITTDYPSFRIKRSQFQYSSGAPTIMSQTPEFDRIILGFLNSKVSSFLLQILNPTVNTTVNAVLSLPFDFNKNANLQIIDNVNENIQISKKDWDDFEISLDFTSHPFLKISHEKVIKKINEIFTYLDKAKAEEIKKIKENEEEINLHFIKEYFLENELSNSVDEKNISLKYADKTREVKSFISYLVGCMFGRYSLDQEGLVYAGGEFDQRKYQTFKADNDNIIPITDDEYFEDDIVSRFIDFVRITFGKENLEENLDFVADTLTRKGNETSRQRIRRYFVKEFYKDHLHIYQKRPIYWLFESGKNDGFKALIYMHRYDLGIVAKVRTDYLHTLQRKYETEITRLDFLLESDVSTQEKTKVKKKKESIQRQLLECQQYDQVIAHVANQKIEINLDDGVKVNYEKFQNIEVSQGEGKKVLKANLLAKI